MGQQVKSWCRQHERLLIFISFLLLSGLSLYFVYFQENFLRASDFRFHQNSSYIITYKSLSYQSKGKITYYKNTVDFQFFKKTVLYIF